MATAAVMCRFHRSACSSNSSGRLLEVCAFLLAALLAGPRRALAGNVSDAADKVHSAVKKLSTLQLALVLSAAGVILLILVCLVIWCVRRRTRIRKDKNGVLPGTLMEEGKAANGLQVSQGQQYSSDRPSDSDTRKPWHPAAGRPVPMESGGSSQASGQTSEYSYNATPQSLNLLINSTGRSFTYEELAAATDWFSEGNFLGQGGFGYVHKGVLPDGQEVAIKQLKAQSTQGDREFQAEIETISRVHHKHLVSLVGHCISDGNRLLVYEYLANDTLHFHLHGRDDQQTLDWPTRLKIALGAGKGLAYLHEDCQPKIIHRDIKATNILLDRNFEAKVADFGLAKFSQDTNTHVSTRVVGTFGYLAPEYAASGKLTDKSDVYSYGVMLLELITGRAPITFNRNKIQESLVNWARALLTRAVRDGSCEALVDPRLETNYDQKEMGQMIACAASCVRQTARSRPRMSQVVRALEGLMSIEDLSKGVLPGQSVVLHPFAGHLEEESDNGDDDHVEIHTNSSKDQNEYKSSSEYVFDSIEGPGPTNVRGR